MSSWAKVGMKVLCVNASRLTYASVPGRKINGAFHLVERETYTIKSIGFVQGHCVVKLEELMDRSSLDDGYALSRFRTLVSQEDDISMFKSLLKPTEVPA